MVGDVDIINYDFDLLIAEKEFLAGVIYRRPGAFEADFAKKKSEIAAQREHIRETGITARGYIGLVLDGLRASRLARSEALVADFFYQTPLGMAIKDLARLSNLHRQIDVLSYGVHANPDFEAELTALRGLKEQWSVIRELAEQEPAFSPELPPNWL